VPSLLHTAPVFKAYVIEDVAGVPTIVTSAENGAVGGNNYIEFTSDGTFNEFKLKHGQSLVFTDVPVGTIFNARETIDINDEVYNKYIPKYKLTIDGISSPEVVGAIGESFLGFNSQHIGEKANIAAFINTHGVIIPTGLLIDDLPYIVLIALTVGALVVFVVLKLRRRKQHDN